MRAFAICLTAVSMSCVAPQVAAQAAAAYPSKPIRIIVPFPAGGPSDVGARVIAEKMAANWNQPVLVENRPGGNTVIGAEAVAKAAPDGYTLLTAIDSTLTMNQHLYSKLPYDPLKDFAPVTLMMWSPIIMVVDAAKGPKSVAELMAQAKANPGKLSFGSGTITTQLAGELIKSMAGINTIYVPYKGSPGTVQGLLSNDVNYILDGVTSSMPHIKSGKFRVLARLSSRPISALPDLPPIAQEPGLGGFDVAVWLGLAAPAGTPADVVGKIHQEVTRIYTLPDVREKLAAVGIDPATMPPAEFATFVRTEAARWGKVIKEAGIKLE